MSGEPPDRERKQNTQSNHNWLGALAFGLIGIAGFGQQTASANDKFVDVTYAPVKKTGAANPATDDKRWYMVSGHRSWLLRKLSFPERHHRQQPNFFGQHQQFPVHAWTPVSERHTV